eukprot:6808-Heterococcus_DN1.PRE.1
MCEANYTGRKAKRSVQARPCSKHLCSSSTFFASPFRAITGVWCAIAGAVRMLVCPKKRLWAVAAGMNACAQPASTSGTKTQRILSNRLQKLLVGA